MSEDPREQKRQALESTLRSVQRKVEKLRGEVTFSKVLKKASDCESDIPETQGELERLRARGYAFRGDLETMLQEVHDEIGDASENLQSRAERATDRLRGEARQLSNAASRITGDALRNEGRIESIENRVRSFEREVDQVEETLSAIISPLQNKLNTVKNKVKDLHWTLDQFDSASFSMRPEERPVAVAEATWEDAPSNDTPKGLLLLTDHRIYFEQKEDRVTKRKFIFFTAESESLHELLIDEPLGHLQESTDDTRGWVMKDQLLTFAWAKAAKVPDTTTFKLSSGTAKDWDEVVELIRSGDLASYEASAAAGSRAPDVVGGAPPPGASHQVRWPENCQSCQAPLTAPVKGQTAIVCDYCSTNHAVEYVTG